MKKTLFSLLVLVGITATAQVKVGSNPTTINTTTTNFQVEGTTTADQFVVLKNGNVGIGTSSPTSKLEVAGVPMTTTIETEEITRFSRPFVGGVRNATSSGIRTGSFETGIVGRGRMDLMVSGAPVAGNSFGIIPDVNVMTLNGNGNVGIGTTAPTERLHVNGPVTFNGPTLSDKTSAGSIDYFSNGVRILSWGAGATDASISFATGAANAGVNERMRIHTNGNVGIGTTSPSQKLHVVGGALVSALAGTGSRMVVADATGVLSTQSIPTGNAGTVTSVTGSAPISVATGTTTPVISIATANTSTTGALTGADWTTFNNKIGTATNGLTASAGNVKLGGALIENTSLTGNFNFTIPGTGNVGIGTSSPTAKLEVAGVPMTTTIETEEITRFSRPFVGGVRNATSSGIRTGSFETGIVGRGRMDLMVSGFPSAGNSFGNIPDVNVMTLNGDGNVGISTTTPTSKLQVAGSVATVVNNTAANITLTEANSTVTVDLSAAALTVTLPAASTCNGRIYNISRTDATTNVLTFSLPISIGSTTFTTSNIPGANFSIQSNGSNWRLINN